MSAASMAVSLSKVLVELVAKVGAKDPGQVMEELEGQHGVGVVAESKGKVTRRC